MSKIIVIADDLTGANATNALLVSDGFKSATFLNLDKYISKENEALSVVSISTDSRAIEGKEAYNKVKDIVEFFKDEDVSLFSKRIDSTLRGNIGSEISAVLDNLSDDTYAIVVPSFPSSKRVCIGGYLMVDQVPLEKTDVAKDPKTPISTSCVRSLLEKQTSKKIGFVELNNVLKGIDYIEKAILREINNDSKIIVVDATTDEDICKIAKAVKNSGKKVISVDPGPFTSALSKEFMEKSHIEAGQKVMLTVGSVTDLTRKQLQKLEVKHSPLLVEVNAKQLIYNDTRQSEIDKTVDIISKDISNYQVVGVTTTSNESEILDLDIIADDLKISKEDVSQRITRGLAKITSEVLKNTDSLIGGLYTSGGDVTVAVCDILGAAGIEIKDEVSPLTVYGRLMKGDYDNTPIITKGGLIGDEKTISTCVDYLLTKLSTKYHIKLGDDYNE